ncbi:MAG: FtsX-like permease family protein [Sandaracinaceae bacterium]|nr:FtsX-like permease family protein [Sandaracinaceae bacterium]
MRRQLALLDYAVGALGRRAGKSAALGAGLAFVVALFGAALLLTDAIRAEHERLVEEMPDLTVQRLVAGRPALIAESFADELRGLPAVRAVEPRVWGYYFFAALEANVTIVGTERADPALDAALAHGRLPREGAEVAIGEDLADHLGLRVGDAMGIPLDGDIVFSPVVGTFGGGSAIRSADLVVARPAHARRLLDVEEGWATDLAVDLTTEDEARVITRRITERLPGARVLERRLLRRTYELTFDARGGLLAFLLVPALAAFLLLAWERLSGLGDAERREIGILKAIGWATADVLAARVYESLVLSLTGAAVGIALAYAYVFWLGAPGLWGALLGWSNLRPALDLAPALDPLQALSLLGAVVVPFVAVGVVPAWRAATLDPDRAMRGAE